MARGEVVREEIERYNLKERDWDGRKWYQERSVKSTSKVFDDCVLN